VSDAIAIAMTIASLPVCGADVYAAIAMADGRQAGARVGVKTPGVGLRRVRDRAPYPIPSRVFLLDTHNEFGG
jgi:hypothetical protein